MDETECDLPGEEEAEPGQSNTSDKTSDVDALRRSATRGCRRRPRQWIDQRLPIRLTTDRGAPIAVHQRSLRD